MKKWFRVWFRLVPGGDGSDRANKLKLRALACKPGLKTPLDPFF